MENPDLSGLMPETLKSQFEEQAGLVREASSTSPPGDEREGGVGPHACQQYELDIVSPTDLKG